MTIKVILEKYVEIYHAQGMMKHIETHGIHTKNLVFPCVSTCFHMFRFPTAYLHSFEMSTTTYSKIRTALPFFVHLLFTSLSTYGRRHRKKSPTKG